LPPAALPLMPTLMLVGCRQRYVIHIARCHTLRRLSPLIPPLSTYASTLRDIAFTPRLRHTLLMLRQR